MNDEQRASGPIDAPVARPITSPEGLRAARGVPAASPGGAGAVTMDALLVLVLGVLLPFLPGLILLNLTSDAGTIEPIGAAVVLQKSSEAAIALLLLAYMVLRHGYPARLFGLRLDAPIAQLSTAAVTLGGLYGALLTVSVGALAVFWLLGTDVSAEMQQRVEFAQAMPLNDRATLLALLAGVALHEEIVFRGLLLPLLRVVSGSWLRAALLTSALFGVLHVPGQGPLAGVQTFALSLVFSAMFVRGRSLAALIAAHFTYDALQLELIRLLRDVQWPPAFAG